MVGLAIVCMLAAVTFVTLRHPLRTLCRKVAMPRPGFVRFAQQWMWQLPGATGYGYLLDEGYRPGQSDNTTVWRGAQIVLATEVDDGLVLDCLVSGSAAADTPAGAIGEPLTLWTHRLDCSTANSPDGGVVSAWTAAGTPVDIFCDRHGGTQRLHICHGTRMVDLALDRTT